MKKTWPVLLLLVLTIVFFSRVILGGEVFFFGDNLSLFLPVLTLFTNFLKKGILPLWNPYLFSGTPFLADVGLGILNPLNFAFFVLPNFQAFSLIIVLEIFLAGWFTYCLLRNLKQDHWASLLGGVVFAFSGTMLTFINNISLLSTAYLLPLVFLLATKTLSKRSPRWAVFLGLGLVWQFISGHPQPVYYSYGCLLFYFLFFPKVSLKKKAFLGLIALATFIGGGAFSWLPFGQLIILSSRPRSDFAYSSAWALHPLLLLRFFLPSFFGSARKGFSWGPSFRWVADNTGYFGLWPSLIIFLRLRRKKKKPFLNFFFTSLVISLLLAMGNFTPVFKLFYLIFPGFSKFRSPTQILLLTNFSAAILVGLCWSDFLKVIQLKKRSKFVRNLVLISCFGWLFFSKLWQIRNQLYPWLYQQVEKLYFFLKGIPLARSPIHNFQTDQIIIFNLVEEISFIFLFLTLGSILIFLLEKKKLTKDLFSFGLLLLSFVNLMVFNRNNLFLAPREKLQTDSRVADFLSADQDHGRLVSSAGFWPFTGLNVYWENVSLRPPFADSIYNQQEQESLGILNTRLQTIPPNWNVVYGLETP
ncbi:hypothetical protein ACFLZP_03725, partial [Patescibacteria group bacterium]